MLIQEHAIGKYDRALAWYQNALECGTHIDLAVHQTCLQRMIEIYRYLGKASNPSFRFLEQFLAKMGPSYVPKDVVFVLDMSGR